MYIEIDLSAVPPITTLHEPDDFKSFKVIVTAAQHAYVDVDELKRLAGDRAGDPDWQKGFEAMLAFASDQGWVDESGRVRAHVEPRT